MLRKSLALRTLRICLTMAVGLIATLAIAKSPMSPTTPTQVLTGLCAAAHTHPTAFAKKWIDPREGVLILRRDGTIERSGEYDILNSSLLEFIEGRHQIDCPPAFSAEKTVCRKSAGGEAYRYVFEKRGKGYRLTQIEVEFEE